MKLVVTFDFPMISLHVHVHIARFNIAIPGSDNRALILQSDSTDSILYYNM